MTELQCLRLHYPSLAKLLDTLASELVSVLRLQPDYEPSDKTQTDNGGNNESCRGRDERLATKRGGGGGAKKRGRPALAAAAAAAAGRKSKATRKNARVKLTKKSAKKVDDGQYDKPAEPQKQDSIGDSGLLTVNTEPAKNTNENAIDMNLPHITKDAKIMLERLVMTQDALESMSLISARKFMSEKYQGKEQKKVKQGLEKHRKPDSIHEESAKSNSAVEDTVNKENEDDSTTNFFPITQLLDEDKLSAPDDCAIVANVADSFRPSNLLVRISAHAFQCAACARMLATASAATDHLSSSDHFRDRLLADFPPVPTKSPSVVRCTVCQTLNSSKNYYLHLAKTHKKLRIYLSEDDTKIVFPPLDEEEFDTVFQSFIDESSYAKKTNDSISFATEEIFNTTLDLADIYKNYDYSCEEDQLAKLFARSYDDSNDSPTFSESDDEPSSPAVTETREAKFGRRELFAPAAATPQLRTSEESSVAHAAISRVSEPRRASLLESRNEDIDSDKEKLLGERVLDGKAKAEKLPHLIEAMRKMESYMKDGGQDIAGHHNPEKFAEPDALSSSLKSEIADEKLELVACGSEVENGDHPIKENESLSELSAYEQLQARNIQEIKEKFRDIFGNFSLKRKKPAKFDATKAGAAAAASAKKQKVQAAQAVPFTIRTRRSAPSK